MAQKKPTKPSSTRRRAAKKKRAVSLPTKYSKEYPIHGGHFYSVKSIPVEIWNAAVERAQREELSIRTVIIRGLDAFARQGLPSEPAEAGANPAV